MKKIIRLTESDLVRLVKQVVREEKMTKQEPKEYVDYMSSDLTTAEAIYTMIGTVIGLLGVSGGFKMLGDLVKGLMADGKEEEAMAIQDAMSEYSSEEGDEDMGFEDEEENY
jgi:hypothetical protein